MDRADERAQLNLLVSVQVSVVPLASEHQSLPFLVESVVPNFLLLVILNKFCLLGDHSQVNIGLVVQRILDISARVVKWDLFEFLVHPWDVCILDLDPLWMDLERGLLLDDLRINLILSLSLSFLL